MIANRSESTPRQIAELPPFERSEALTLHSVCRLGLVPGHGGRRLDVRELERWVSDGVQLAWGGPRYLFPCLWNGGMPVTTVAWCAAWVEFVAAEQRAHLCHQNSSNREDSQGQRERHSQLDEAAFQPSA